MFPALFSYHDSHTLKQSSRQAYTSRVLQAKAMIEAHEQVLMYVASGLSWNLAAGPLALPKSPVCTCHFRQSCGTSVQIGIIGFVAFVLIIDNFNHDRGRE